MNDHNDDSVTASVTATIADDQAKWSKPNPHRVSDTSQPKVEQKIGAENSVTVNDECIGTNNKKCAAVSEGMQQMPNAK
jgi:hypothetical protein